MDHRIYRVQSVEVTAPYTLLVHFDDDTAQTINLQPILAGQLYGPLRDLTLFNQVRVDPEVHTLVWPNGADFSSVSSSSPGPTILPTAKAPSRPEHYSVPLGRRAFSETLGRTEKDDELKRNKEKTTGSGVIPWSIYAS